MDTDAGPEGSHLQESDAPQLKVPNESELKESDEGNGEDPAGLLSPGGAASNEFSNARALLSRMNRLYSDIPSENGEQGGTTTNIEAEQAELRAKRAKQAEEEAKKQAEEREKELAELQREMDAKEQRMEMKAAEQAALLKRAQAHANAAREQAKKNAESERLAAERAKELEQAQAKSDKEAQEKLQLLEAKVEDSERRRVISDSFNQGIANGGSESSAGSGMQEAQQQGEGLTSQLESRLLENQALEAQLEKAQKHKVRVRSGSCGP
jgi:colicin import membrane protein